MPAAFALAFLTANVMPTDGQQEWGARGGDAHMKRLTPIITVEQIEPCLGFWIDRLGFEKTMEVPEGDRLGFALLQFGDIEVMYQTHSSVAADLPALATEMSETSSVLFVEVDDLDALKPKLDGVEIVVPERETFYGSREIWVRAPCATVVGLAEFGEQQ
jgi:uncharacterized glyoxalase superfamily protein PhnB